MCHIIIELLKLKKLLTIFELISVLANYLLLSAILSVLHFLLILKNKIMIL